MNMNFDILYKHLCESLRGDELLADDGKREVYYSAIYLDDYYESKHVHDINIQPPRRMHEHDVFFWDTTTGRVSDMCIGKSNTLEQALEKFSTEYLLSRNINNVYGPDHEYNFDPSAAEYIVKKLRRMFQPYTHFPGEWGYTCYVEHDVQHFGIEVDIATYRVGGLLSVTADDTTDDEGSIMDL